MQRFLSLLAASVLFAAPAAARPTLDPVWSDLAVIQRGQPVVLSGTARPGAKVEVRLGDERAEAQADSAGRFTVQLAPRPASADPLALVVDDQSGEALTFSGLVVGDVWLCSGQSNMEYPLSRGLDAGSRIGSSADPDLRLLTIPKDTAPAPTAAFGVAVNWVRAAPATAADFSAACFIMAQQLRRQLGIPIGAIHSSWGGSQIRAWLTPQAGRALYGEAEMALLGLATTDMPRAVAGFAPTWESWWRDSTLEQESGGQEPWRDPDSLEWLPVPAIAPWTQWSGTRLATDPIGTVFLRRTVNLTAAQAAAGSTLSIGVIDDIDMTWVNGQPIGNTHGWSAERHYPLVPGVLREGANEIIVAASNSWSAGGFTSPADRLFLTLASGEVLPLGEGWRYSIGSQRAMPPRAPWDANAGIGVMHNRMIAPLGQIALAGAAWYQGESDAGIPGYADRLRELIAGWRAQFGAQTRMVVVQLPNYGAPATAPGPSGWADLREAQRQAVMADGNAALVPTIGLGERTDIHPANKTDLGIRMAMAAMGQPMPMPLMARSEGAQVRLTFTGLEGGLHAWSGAPISLELCGEADSTCRYAAARIDEGSMLIADDGQPATRIRHGWAENPLVNLHDGRALPLPGFEIAITP